MSKKRTKKPIVVLTSCVALFVAACSHTYGLNRQLAGQKTLPSNAVVYVALPEPGAMTGQVYEDSGRQTGEAIVAALDSGVGRTLLGSTPEIAEEARATAAEQGASHLVFPEIVHWEDRATQWSGKPDRIRIRLHVYAVASGELLDAAEVTGASRWGTLGGDHPQDLLARAVGDYLKTVMSIDSGR